MRLKNDHMDRLILHKPLALRNLYVIMVLPVHRSKFIYLVGEV
ncbi:hypothetical protein BRC2024_PQPTKSFJ_CDS_0011 [Tegunavirus sp. BRC001]